MLTVYPQGAQSAAAARTTVYLVDELDADDAPILRRTALPAGASGLNVSGQVRQTRDKNLANARAGRRDAMEEAFREVSLADRDEDNAQGRERIDLLRKQIDQGKYKLEKSADGLVLVD